MKFLLPLLLLLPLLAPAQTLHQQGYWARLYLRTHVGKRLTLHTDVEERRFVLPDRQWLFITNHHLHYRVSPVWDVALGGAYLSQAQRGLSVPERRGFEEISATLPLLNQFRFQTRLRVEQRWLGQVVGSELSNEWSYATRYRGRLQLEWLLSPVWKVRTSNEVLMYRSGFDQDQLSVIAERQLGAGFATELGYLHIWQQRAANLGYYGRDVLRVTLVKDLWLFAAK